MSKIKEKIAHEWSLIAQSSAIDAESNNVSVFNVIDQITVAAKEQSKPQNLPIPFIMMNVWRNKTTKDLKDLTVKLELIDPNNNTVLEGQYKISKIQNKHRQRTKFEGLKFTKFGKYRIRISCKMNKGEFKKYHEVVFDVKKQIS